MTPEKAKAQIIQAIEDHEDVHITRSAMVTIIGETINGVHDDAFKSGVAEATKALDMQDDEEYEVTFEDLDDDDDEDDFDPRDPHENGSPW